MISQLFKLQANFIKALAHERRLEILYLLKDQDLNVSDIHQMLDLPQANISQHLKILKAEDIVTVRKEGKESYYAIAQQQVIQCLDHFKEMTIERHKHALLSKEYEQSLLSLAPLVHDPVCGMQLSPKTASFQITHDGHSYYFCASGCLKSFSRNPYQFIKGDSL